MCVYVRCALACVWVGGYGCVGVDVGVDDCEEQYRAGVPQVLYRVVSTHIHIPSPLPQLHVLALEQVLVRTHN